MTYGLSSDSCLIDHEPPQPISVFPRIDRTSTQPISVIPRIGCGRRLLSNQANPGMSSLPSCPPGRRCLSPSLREAVLSTVEGAKRTLPEVRPGVRDQGTTSPDRRVRLAPRLRQPSRLPRLDLDLPRAPPFYAQSALRTGGSARGRAGLVASSRGGHALLSCGTGAVFRNLNPRRPSSSWRIRSAPAVIGSASTIASVFFCGMSASKSAGRPYQSRPRRAREPQVTRRRAPRAGAHVHAERLERLDAERLEPDRRRTPPPG